MVITPEELLCNALKGDRQAFSDLLELLAPSIREAIHIPPQFRNLLSVDDVMQETYLDAFLEWPRFEPRGEDRLRSTVAWLRMIAKRNLIDARRGLEAVKRGGDRRPVSGRGAADPDGSMGDLLESLLSGEGTTPSVAAAREEALGALWAAIEQLPPPARMVVTMYDIERKDAREVAEMLGCSPGAVYMRRARAHRMLKDHLGRTSRFFSDCP